MSCAKHKRPKEHISLLIWLIIQELVMENFELFTIVLTPLRKAAVLESIRLSHVLSYFLTEIPFFSAWVVMSKSCYYVTQVEVVSGGYLPTLRWIVVLVYTKTVR